MVETEIEVGTEISETSAANNWTIVDGLSGTEKTVDHEPTRADLDEFRRERGYSTMKVNRVDHSCNTVTVRPVDKSGN